MVLKCNLIYSRTLRDTAIGDSTVVVFETRGRFFDYGLRRPDIPDTPAVRHGAGVIYEAEGEAGCSDVAHIAVGGGGYSGNGRGRRGGMPTRKGGGV